jgi:hypothetical protein
MAGLEQECFFIAPIGSVGSPERERSDGVRDFIVKPAVAELGLNVMRADDIGQPGQITHQVIEHVLGARGAVADLSDRNANVYYELAVRHAARLPVVLIASESERKRLPFDVNQMRTIFFDHTNLGSAAAAKAEITLQLQQALDGAVDSPITTAMTLQRLEGGSSVEQTLADLVTRVENLASLITSQPRAYGAGGYTYGVGGSGIMPSRPSFIPTSGTVFYDPSVGPVTWAPIVTFADTPEGPVENAPSEAEDVAEKNEPEGDVDGAQDNSSE